MTKLTTLNDDYSACAANNDKLATAFDNTISRDGSSPNEMNANLDMNGNLILNCAGVVLTDDPTFTGTLTADDGVFDSITLSKAQGEGIKVDAADPTFTWRDIIGKVQPKATGAGFPTRAVYNGGTLADYSFAVNDVVDFVFHIPHDWVPGTDLYFHVHWSHNDSTSVTGNATFTIYHSYAKGHNQDEFTAEKNFAITYATTNIATTPRYRHRIDETQMSISGGSASLLDTDDIEPDGLIIATLKLTAIPTFGAGGKLFIHTCDIHYLSTNIGTKQRAPDFYV